MCGCYFLYRCHFLLFIGWATRPVRAGIFQFANSLWLDTNEDIISISLQIRYPFDLPRLLENDRIREMRRRKRLACASFISGYSSFWFQSVFVSQFVKLNRSSLYIVSLILVINWCVSTWSASSGTIAAILTHPFDLVTTLDSTPVWKPTHTINLSLLFLPQAKTRRQIEVYALSPEASSKAEVPSGTFSILAKIVEEVRALFFLGCWLGIFKLHAYGLQ